MDVARRKITADAARKKGIKISDKELQQAFDIYRIANNLHKANKTEEWLKSRGITQEYLENFVETNLLIQRFKDQLENEADLKDYTSHPEIAAAIREKIYGNWLRNETKIT